MVVVVGGLTVHGRARALGESGTSDRGRWAAGRPVALATACKHHPIQLGGICSLRPSIKISSPKPTLDIHIPYTTVHLHRQSTVSVSDIVVADSSSYHNFALVLYSPEQEQTNLLPTTYNLSRAQGPT